MRASVNRLEHLALDVLPQGAGLVREQTSEVARLVAERERGEGPLAYARRSEGLVAFSSRHDRLLTGNRQHPIHYEIL